VPELELDALNSNPCMPGILAIIDYLVSPDFASASGGESQKEASSGSSAKQKSKEKEVPKWMAFLLAKITAAGTNAPCASPCIRLTCLSKPARYAWQRAAIHRQGCAQQTRRVQGTAGTSCTQAPTFDSLHSLPKGLCVDVV